MIQRIVLANDVLLPEVIRLLNEGENIMLRAKGNSMLPFIVGDRDSVMLCRSENLNIGDIALAHLSDGRYVLHRILSFEGDRVRLMGDGNIYGTEECPKNDIAGIAIKILRNGKPVDCTSVAEQFNVKLWGVLKPFRRYLLAIYKRMK